MLTSFPLHLLSLSLLTLQKCAAVPVVSAATTCPATDSPAVSNPKPSLNVPTLSASQELWVNTNMTAEVNAFTEIDGMIEDGLYQQPTQEIQYRSTSDPSSGSPFEGALVKRARELEDPRYREIALLQGVLMIWTQNGHVGDASGMEDIGALGSSVWAADHVFELALFDNFLQQAGQQAVRSLIRNCPYILRRFTNILNGPGNLIGVDRTLNMLKMLFLQRNGPRNYNVYPAFTYHGLVHYMSLVQPMWQGTVELLASALDDMLYSLGEPAPFQLGNALRQWALIRWDQGMATLNQNLPALPAAMGAFENIHDELR
ncbi:MAG: hypothetical protein M1817_005833 [Caeruleum heppii]|nr:MAG: hypothetical protein M1817_005833 [Caeruleum heppii]